MPGRRKYLGVRKEINSHPLITKIFALQNNFNFDIKLQGVKTDSEQQVYVKLYFNNVKPVLQFDPKMYNFQISISNPQLVFLPTQKLKGKIKRNPDVPAQILALSNLNTLFSDGKIAEKNIPGDWDKDMFFTKTLDPFLSKSKILHIQEYEEDKLVQNVINAEISIVLSNDKINETCNMLENIARHLLNKPESTPDTKTENKGVNSSSNKRGTSYADVLKRQN